VVFRVRGHSWTEQYAGTLRKWYLSNSGHVRSGSGFRLFRLLDCWPTSRFYPATGCFDGLDGCGGSSRAISNRGLPSRSGCNRLQKGLRRRYHSNHQTSEAVSGLRWKKLFRISPSRRRNERSKFKGPRGIARSRWPGI